MRKTWAGYKTAMASPLVMLGYIWDQLIPKTKQKKKTPHFHKSITGILAKLFCFSWSVLQGNNLEIDLFRDYLNATHAKKLLNELL